MGIYRIIRGSLLILIISLALFVCLIIANYANDKDRMYESVLELYTTDEIYNSKHFNFNGKLFWLIMSMFIAGFIFIVTSLLFIVDLSKNGHRMILPNICYVVFFATAGVLITLFNYKVMDFYGSVFDSLKYESNISAKYNPSKVINIFKFAYFSIYVISFILLIVNMLNFKYQYKFFRVLTFRWHTSNDYKINNEFKLEKEKKAMKNLKKTRGLQQYNFENFKKVSTNFNRLVWIDDFNTDLVLEMHEIDEIIDRYSKYSEYKSLVNYTFRNKFNVFIADENFKLSLFPSYVENIENSFYYINLFTKYCKNLFLAAYYKYAKHIAATLEHSLTIVYRRITMQILSYENLDKKLIKIANDNLNDFIAKIYAILRNYESKNMSINVTTNDIIEYGKEFYHDLTERFSKEFEYSYNEIIRIQDEMYTGDYNDDVMKHKNDKVKTALDYFGLNPKSTYDDFKNKYRELIRIYHPDANSKNSEDSIKKITLINLNREILEEYFQN
ncbi:hypothetical protein SLITO_v1c05490 [Spiroplasma litorale]|uniref:J domain-containing protein n=1 Tax=Spiroplasma litorale TaxID=216942 RepID=A0A0K1W1I9_9MOLU|nr:J domain-containing protein [Spiroplasma litorale]AKX34189.1 hypothetical protein SLITO_v1c05490 [Spiroplasma litorale]